VGLGAALFGNEEAGAGAPLEGTGADAATLVGRVEVPLEGAGLLGVEVDGAVAGAAWGGAPLAALLDLVVGLSCTLSGENFDPKRPMMLNDGGL